MRKVALLAEVGPGVIRVNVPKNYCVGSGITANDPDND